MTFYVGIDIGGTFTDAVVLDEAGDVRLLKTPTTLDNPARGVDDALQLAETELGLRPGQLLAETAYLGLGTTVATNAMIERRGVRTGIITTRGFRDTLLMQRGMGQWVGLSFEEAAHYSQRRFPEPLVPRTRTVEVTERIDYNGDLVVALDENDARAAIRALLDDDVQAIAVCLLWSFRDPSHELRLRELIAEESRGADIFVTLSSDIAPMMGEYERMATTAMNAYLGPTVQRYMRTLQDGFAERGLVGAFRVMDSAGGVMSPEVASAEPVAILTSGPAGGVLASVALARRLGTPNVITTDMGGTSFDVSLIVGGRPTMTGGQDVSGYHVLRSAVDVTAIGAGGGSIAKVRNGVLEVGPDSAGSMPGPACYGKGGVLPTVTDADVVLGILDPAYFLAGRMSLNTQAAHEAIEKHVAIPLRISVLEAAVGIKRIADHQMADLLDTLTIGKGYDPRDFVVFAFGGASAGHCHAYAAELGISRVIVPSTATVHSAFGAATSDLHAVAELTQSMQTPPFVGDPARHLDLEMIVDTFQRLEERAIDQLCTSGAEASTVTIERFVEVSYRMQVNKLTVPVASGPLGEAAIVELVQRFDATYTQLYGEGSGFREAGLELSTFRVHGRSASAINELHHNDSLQADAGAIEATAVGTRRVHIGPNGTAVSADVYRGEEQQPGARIPGPAVIEYPGTTVVVGLGQHAIIDPWRNAVLFTGVGSTESTESLEDPS